MSGKLFLLDTNIVIVLFANERIVVRQIEKAIGIFVPAIVFGELFYGAELSTRKEENIKTLNNFSLACQIIDCNFETAKCYARVKSYLKKKSNPIPENDLWIAALALQYELILATRDKHFDKIKGLKLAKW